MIALINDVEMVVSSNRKPAWVVEFALTGSVLADGVKELSLACKDLDTVVALVCDKQPVLIVEC
jgi:hypothetical protein